MGRKLRVVFAALGVLVVVFFLSGLSPKVQGFAHFEFFWHVLLGTGLGALLALLPQLAGATGPKAAFRTQWWIAVVCVGLVLLIQFLLLNGMLAAPWLNWLKTGQVRVIMAESALLGTLLVWAVKAKR